MEMMVLFSRNKKELKRSPEDVVAEAKERFNQKNVPFNVHMGNNHLRFLCFKQYFHFMEAMYFAPPMTKTRNDYSVAQAVYETGRDMDGNSTWDGKTNLWSDTRRQMYSINHKYGVPMPDFQDPKYKDFEQRILRVGQKASKMSVKKLREAFVMQQGLDPQILYQKRDNKDSNRFTSKANDVYRVSAVGHRPSDVYNNLKALDEQYDTYLNKKSGSDLSNWLQQHNDLGSYINNLNEDGYYQGKSLLDTRMRVLNSSKKQLSGEYQKDRMAHVTQMYFQSYIKKTLQEHPGQEIEFHTNLDQGTGQIFARAVLAEKGDTSVKDRNRIKLVADWLGPGQFMRQSEAGQGEAKLLLSQCDKANLYVVQNNKVFVNHQNPKDINLMLKNWKTLQDNYEYDVYAFLQKDKQMISNSDEISAVYDRQFVKTDEVSGRVKHTATGRAMALAVSGNVDEEPKPIDNTYQHRNVYESRTRKKIVAIDPLELANSAIKLGACPTSKSSRADSKLAVRQREGKQFWNCRWFNGQRIATQQLDIDKPAFQKRFFASLGIGNPFEKKEQPQTQKIDDQSLPFRN